MRTLNRTSFLSANAAFRSVAFLALLVLLLGATFQVEAGMAGWKHRVAITIESDDIDSDLTNWTMVFDQSFDAVLTQVNGPLDADGTRAALNGGGDIRFSNDAAGSNRLAADIRTFITNNSPANGRCEIAVKIPSVSSSTDTTIYMWWGKAGETQPAVGAAFGQYAAYDSNYVGVWTLNEDPSGSAPQMRDRTSNVKHGQSQGSMTNTDSVDGAVGNALNFDGSNDRVRFGANGDFSFGTSGDLTVSAVVKLDGLQPDDYLGTRFAGVATKGTLSGTNPGFGIYTRNEAPSCQIRDTANNVSGINGTTNLNDGNWHFFGCTLNRTSQELELFADGSSEGTTSSAATGSISNSGTPFVSGSRLRNATDNAFHFDGRIDSVRLSSVARPAAWLKADHRNQLDVTGFQSWGSILDVGQNVLGNLVFNDLDNDGLFESGDGEVGLANVIVRLYEDNGSTPGEWDVTDTLKASTQTDVNGIYTFTDLPDGEFLILIDQANLSAGQALEGFYSSLADAAASDPDDDTDGDDNGTPVSGSGFASRAVTLSAGNEPGVGVDGDGVSGNLTVDFGFIKALAPVVAAGPDQISDANVSLNLAASFTDPNTSGIYTALIDWGDGTVEAGVVDQINRTVSGNHTYLANGVRTVTVSVTNAFGLTGVGTLQVSVGKVPVALADAYKIENDEALVVAAPGVLGNDNDPDGGSLSAQLVSPASNGSVALSANGSFSYSAVAGFVGQDSFTYQANNATLGSTVVTVTIQVYAPLTANPQSAPSVIFAGGESLLSSAPSGGSGVGISYLWSGPDGFTSTLQNPGAITFRVGGFFTYSLTVVDSEGFSDTATVNVAVLGSVLEPNPVASPALIPLGQSTTLSSSPVGGSGNYVGYLWSGPNGYSSTQQNPGLVTPGSSGLHTYSLTVTDAAGIDASASVDVLVGELLPGIFVNSGGIKYKVSSASSADRPLDGFKVKLQGLTLNPGDRLALDFNGVSVGDLKNGDGLTLDSKGRARGQLSSGQHVFTRCSAKYVARKRLLTFVASKGIAARGGQPLVQAASGKSPSVWVAVLVDRAPADGVVDLAAIVPVIFKVKVRTSRVGVTTEMGRVKR